ncbi:MAG: hypothetical protein MN733_34100, partial [Nitrososphaera sp.]|nr:hypothetical protein [Nitrososphaera sp.]
MRYRKNRSLPLDQHRTSLTATDAKGGHATSRLVALKDAQQMQNDAGAARPDGMTHADPAAVHVQA